METIPDLVLEKMLVTLVESGYIGPEILRNFRILHEFRELTRDGPEKISGVEARERLAEKYYITPKAIEHIISRTGKKEKETMYKLELKLSREVNNA